jgi:hypothetical protein
MLYNLELNFKLKNFMIFVSLMGHFEIRDENESLIVEPLYGGIISHTHTHPKMMLNLGQDVS